MRVEGRRILVCSCEGSMPIDAAALGKALGTERPHIHTRLCRDGLDAFAGTAAEEGRLVVACTQEARIFREMAEERETNADVTFTNIRERAGWSSEARDAVPKIAALLREAVVDVAPAAALPLRSDGRVLVFGAGETAFAAARQLAERMTVTCVVDDFAGLVPPSTSDMALLRGRVVAASGHMGAFRVRLANVVTPAPSSRGTLVPSGPAGAETTLDADAVLDLSGGPPLFPGARGRDGYVRAEPGDLVGVQKAVMAVADLTGEFEKPRYVRVDPDICAHSRAGIRGCTRCLDACPSGAVAPMGDHVAVDAFACSGHGACASVCPTGAIHYDLPDVPALFERLRVLLGTYYRAKGRDPVLLVHDRAGEEAINLSARFGRGLPAHVLPFAVQETTSIGLDFMLTALAFGAARVVLLTAPEVAAETAHLESAADLCRTVLAGLGYEGERVRVETVGDPDALESLLYEPPPLPAAPAEYMVRGPKRTTFRMALEHLHKAAPAPVDVLPVPAGAPFGRVRVNTEGCTLCLACVGACPTQALGDNPDRPQLTFREAECVQCGLCAATCPEKVIALEPRIDFVGAGERGIVKEEEPFACVRCGKEFGTKSTIDRMVAKLSGHAMFQSGLGVQILQMCDDCRVIAQAEQGSPYFPSTPGRRTRTTADYLAERKNGNKE